MIFESNSTTEVAHGASYTIQISTQNMSSKKMYLPVKKELIQLGKRFCRNIRHFRWSRRNKVREKMLISFVLENPLKSLHKGFVYRTLKENFELDDKTLGYDFRPESFFPTSWGGEYTVVWHYKMLISRRYVSITKGRF